MIRVLVAGAAGKMGKEVVDAVSQASDIQIVALVDTAYDEHSAAVMLDSVAYARLGHALADKHPDVMVDFTHPKNVLGNVLAALNAGVHCVVGTTGLTPGDLSQIATACKHNGANCFVAPNFAIGAVLMMMFAGQAALYLPDAEITELHHDKKADAPSGTAIRTASMIAAARSETPNTPGRETELPGMEGARGAVIDGVHVHSVRLPGLVAHQEVIFGGQGQTLTIRHDSINRTSFMPGVLLAVRKVAELELGVTVGLEHLL